MTYKNVEISEFDTRVPSFERYTPVLAEYTLVLEAQQAAEPDPDMPKITSEAELKAAIDELTSPGAKPTKYFIKKRHVIDRATALGLVNLLPNTSDWRPRNVGVVADVKETPKGNVYTTKVHKDYAAYDMGTKNEEELKKYTDQTGIVGEIGNIEFEGPFKIQISNSSHAAHQQYRVGHREKPVTDAEVLADLKTAGPQIAKLITTKNFKPGRETIGTSAVYDDKRVLKDSHGNVWIYNSDSRLNLIIQVKKAEKTGTTFSILVVSINRQREMHEFGPLKYRAKIVISGGNAKLEREGVIRAEDNNL